NATRDRRRRGEGRVVGVTDPTAILTAQEAAAVGLDDWRQAITRLQTRFLTGDFASGLALLDRIGDAAEEMNHHPDLLLRYPSLTVTLTSHDVGGITSRDIELAARISEFAAAAGVHADTGSISQVEWAL